MISLPNHDSRLRENRVRSYFFFTQTSIHNHDLVGGLNPPEKYESQLGWWHSQWKVINNSMVPVTTNQWLTSNEWSHQCPTHWRSTLAAIGLGSPLPSLRTSVSGEDFLKPTIYIWKYVDLRCLFEPLNFSDTVCIIHILGSNKKCMWSRSFVQIQPKKQ